MNNSKYHLNTVYIRPQQRLQPLPYQQLKSQLSRQNYFNPQFVQNNPSSSHMHNTNQQQLDDAMTSLKRLVNDQLSISQLSSLQKKRLAHIHSIKLHPMVNENFISSFDQHQYKLQPQDKVKIVKERVFRVQNYYNYLYQLKCKQQQQKKDKQIQSYIKQLTKKESNNMNNNNMNNNNMNNNNNIRESSANNNNQHPILSVINNNTRLVKQKSQNQQQQSQYRVLDPAYTKYDQGRSNRRKDGQAYFLKQKDRRLVQQESGYRPNSKQHDGGNNDRSSFSKNNYYYYDDDDQDYNENNNSRW